MTRPFLTGQLFKLLSVHAVAKVRQGREGVGATPTDRGLQ